MQVLQLYLHTSQLSGNGMHYMICAETNYSFLKIISPRLKFTILQIFIEN